MTFEELVKNHSGAMIEKLVTHVISQDPVEIRFDYLEQDQWAIITMHEYEEDKEGRRATKETKRNLFAYIPVTIMNCISATMMMKMNFLKLHIPSLKKKKRFCPKV